MAKRAELQRHPRHLQLLPTGDSNTPSILVTFISEPILHSTSRQEPVQPYEGKSGGAPAR